MLSLSHAKLVRNQSKSHSSNHAHYVHKCNQVLQDAGVNVVEVSVFLDIEKRDEKHEEIARAHWSAVDTVVTKP